MNSALRVCLALAFAGYAAPATLTSPNRQLLLPEGSPLPGAEVRIVSAETTLHDETYNLVHGQFNPVRNHYNALRSEQEEIRPPARRCGRDWFVGALTDRSPRQLDIPLSFPPARRFTAGIYADAPDADRNPRNVTISRRSVTRDDILKAGLAAGGGQAIHIFPAGQEAKQ